jgi:hypothetical protein
VKNVVEGASPSRILFRSVLAPVIQELVTAMRTGFCVHREILVAFRTGKRELGPAMRTDFVIGIERVPAVRAQIYAAGRALFVLIAYRFTAVGTERCALDPCLGVHLPVFVLKPLLQFRPTVRTDLDVSRDFLITLGTVETKLGATLSTDGIVKAHGCPTLWTVRLFVHLDVYRPFVVMQISHHGLTLAPGFSTPPGKEKGCHLWRGQPRSGSSTVLNPA